MTDKNRTMSGFGFISTRNTELRVEVASLKTTLVVYRFVALTGWVGLVVALSIM
jgi:hypothetical protein